MPNIDNIIFRRITASDFYYINQPGLKRGGGQSYIDFRTSDVSAADWRHFFRGIPEQAATGGPYWLFSVRSLGTGAIQDNVKVGQRRATTFSIREQKLPEHSNGGRRLSAWTPSATGFPALPPALEGADQVPEALISGLTIFLIRDDDGGIWAGWTRGISPQVHSAALRRIVEETSGLLTPGPGIYLDPNNPAGPFWPMMGVAEEGAEFSPNTEGVETPSAEDWDFADEAAEAAPEIKYVVAEVRQRNRKAVTRLKALYKSCQITGGEFIFIAKNGHPYLEVHHLIPLGEGGADDPANMIVISPQVHRMLHYCEVTGLNLSNIKSNKLAISIGGVPYVITWKPQHANLVTSAV